MVEGDEERPSLKFLSNSFCHITTSGSALSKEVRIL
jgi:hypothetical protein